jgi:hypothetical protein
MESVHYSQCQQHSQRQLTLIRAAIKKSIEWRLQVQIAYSTEVNLAPSRPEQQCKEYGQPGRSMLPAGQNFGCFLMKEKPKNYTYITKQYWFLQQK